MEVIHTETTNCGLSEQLGHLDFYPNSGVKQPGCGTNKCSHSRSYYFYAESLVTTNGFYGRKCSDWKSMTEGKCSGDLVLMGGSGTQPKAEGFYYLKTSDESPFACGP